MTTQTVRRLLESLCMIVTLAGVCGCPAINQLPAPGRTMQLQEPVYKRPYLLYVPSHLPEDREVPLLVACHGTNPFDTAPLQLKEWRGLAEREGFLLAAPELEGTSASKTFRTSRQLEKQAADERCILSMVKAIRAAHPVDENAVFLTGWSAGGYAVLYTGLRHPEVFRALAVRQGNFDEDYVEPCIPFIDPYQPILVMYGSSDILVKRQGLAAIDWLRAHNLHPVVLARPGIHRREPQPILNFFKRVLKRYPLVRIQVHDDPSDAMKVTFSSRTSFTPAKHEWEFGDDEKSWDARPTHVYESPGEYLIRLTVTDRGGTPYYRAIKLKIPRPRFGQPMQQRPTE